jgi:hypothetical protein
MSEEKRYWKIEGEEDYNRVCEITGKKLYHPLDKYIGLTHIGDDVYSDYFGYTRDHGAFYATEGYTLQTLDAPKKPKAWNRTVEMVRESDGVVFTKDTIDGRTIEQIDEEREELRGKLAALNKLVATYKRLDKAGKLD